MQFGMGNAGAIGRARSIPRASEPGWNDAPSPFPAPDDRGKGELERGASAPRKEPFSRRGRDEGYPRGKTEWGRAAVFFRGRGPQKRIDRESIRSDYRFRIRPERIREERDTLNRDKKKCALSGDNIGEKKGGRVGPFFLLDLQKLFLSRRGSMFGSKRTAVGSQSSGVVVLVKRCGGAGQSWLFKERSIKEYPRPGRFCFWLSVWGCEFRSKER